MDIPNIEDLEPVVLPPCDFDCGHISCEIQRGE